MNVSGGNVDRLYQRSTVGKDDWGSQHAQRVISFYEELFGEGPELALLRILGLLDGPADRGRLAALRAAPIIPGLTDALFSLDEQGWQRIVVKLRRANLISEMDLNQPENLDTHPLIREYFRRQLQKQRSDAWREGHKRLYEHLKYTSKEFPYNSEEMAPLYAAITHGCLAGRHREVLHEIYLRRILRGNEQFSWKHLGAFGADLAALSNFFDPPWSHSVAGLSQTDQAFVQNAAGFHLRALGRLTEAVQPMEAGLAANIESADWSNAAISAVNLSSLYLSSGNLAEALANAQRGLELAEKSFDNLRLVAVRTVLADALHQYGRLSESEIRFREAETLQKTLQPDYPLLYSIQGFRYCDLLLDLGRYDEVVDRATQTLQWGIQNDLSLLAIALDHLTLGRAVLAQSMQEQSRNFAKPLVHLETAVNKLRQAGAQEFILLALVTRADLRMLNAELHGAQSDFDEAMSIAKQGNMELYRADCHLGYARLYLAMDRKEEAEANLLTAKSMIDHMGYHRRDRELAELREAL